MIGQSSRPLLRSPLQIAYVTTDMNRACQLMSDRYGISKLWRPGARTFALERGGDMTIDCAHGWVGPTWIEIIQPVDGEVGVYRDCLPQEGFAVRFHHLGIRIHDESEWQATLRGHASRGHRVVFSVTSAASKVCYFDTQEDLGHYLEYLYFFDIENSSLPRIPQNVPGFRTAY